jgi:hypothetical protein
MGPWCPDQSGHQWGHAVDATKSLTYAELADALRLTAGSVRNLVRRKRWPRHVGNDGATRVSVPIEYLDENTPRPPPTDGASHTPSESPTSLPTGGDTQATALQVLTTHIERLGRELEGVKSERDAERAVALSAGIQVAALRGALEEVRAERDRLLTREHLRTSRAWWRRLTG